MRNRKSQPAPNPLWHTRWLLVQLLMEDLLELYEQVRRRARLALARHTLRLLPPARAERIWLFVESGFAARVVGLE